MKNIEIFTGPGCAHCEAAKALLKRCNLDFTEHDISESAALAEFRRRLPRVRAIPQIFADGVHIGNDEDLRIRLSA